MKMIVALFSLLLVSALGQTLITVVGHADLACNNLAVTGTNAITVPAGGIACGLITVGTFSVVGTATVVGNTVTVASCTQCNQQGDACIGTSGTPTTITNGVCEPAAKVGGTGSFAICYNGVPCASTSSSSSGDCFHKDTVITYKSKRLSLDELRAHPECSIPHVVSTYGVSLTATCGAHTKTLRLTSGHLLYTQRGLQAVKDVIPGTDVVYTDQAQKEECQILDVTKESQPQEYFGLNCLNSDVLANGIKASTFEKLHSIPSFWMQVMGKILGIKKASQVGDYIAELVGKMNLI
jgi:hypothetical protein